MKRFAHARVVCCLLILLCSGVLFAQSLEEMLTQIDHAFMQKSPQTVRAILEKTYGSEDYASLEKYVLSKSKGLFITNQLELIQEMTLAVIDVNLGSDEALSLYYVVENTLEKRRALHAEEEKLAAAQKEKEAAYIESIPEPVKAKAEAEYEPTVATESGEKVFIKPAVRNSDTVWNAALNVADVGLVFAPGTSPAIKLCYGLGVSSDVIYYGQGFSLGATFNAAVQPLSVSAGGRSASDVIWDFSFVPIISISGLETPNVYLRLGFMAQQYNNIFDENGKKEIFYSPVVGVNYRNVLLGPAIFDFFAEYYPGHIAYRGIQSAFAFGANVNMPITRLQYSSLILTGSVRDNCFIQDKNFANRFHVTLGIGVKRDE